MGILAAPEKVIKDNVHGYIHIPKALVDNLIDTELFQRLRHIEQTSGSMRALYPAARHDRFSHSLGVYHLGCQAFEALHQQHANGDLAICEGDGPCSTRAWWMRHYVLFTIACLLHDCAHAPFSHALEDYYDMPQQNGDPDGLIASQETLQLTSFKKLDYEMLREFANLEPSFVSDFLNLDGNEGATGTGSPHERLSALMVHRYFERHIRDTFEALRDEGAFDGEDVTLVDSDFARIARMIIGCGYSDARSVELSLVNCFISLLNSNLIDVDGLDYEVRDTVNSGISNWDVDHERIINSIKLCCTTTLSEFVIEGADIRRAVWFGDSRFDVGAYDAEVSRGLIRVKGRCTVRFPDSEAVNSYEHAHSKKKCLLAMNGQLEKFDSSQMAERINRQRPDDLNASLATAVSKGTGDSRFFIMEDKNFNVMKDELEIESLCDDALIEFSGAEIASGLHVELDSECEVELIGFTGVVDGTVCIPPDQFRDIVEASKNMSAPDFDNDGAITKTFALGYWMSAVGLMQNAVDARNTFYQWIFTHPLPAYQCDFLLQHMMKLASKYLCCTHYREKLGGKFPSKEYPLIDCSECPVKKANFEDGLADEDNSEAVAPPSPELISLALIGLDGFFEYEWSEKANSIIAPFRFKFSTDDDLNALFKWVNLSNERAGDKANEIYRKVFGEYFCRPNRKPLWKSYADFCRLFDDAEPSKRPQFKDFARTNDAPNTAGLSNSKSRYLTFIDKDPLVDEIRRRLGAPNANCKNSMRIAQAGDTVERASGSMRELHDFVAVRVRAKTKSINPAAMLVVFPDEQVMRLADVESPNVAPVASQDFFYLYADSA